MAKICTNEKTAARQQWIENGLLELMQEKRFDEISVTDLCRYLNLSRRSFYRYFHDLEDVLDLLMHRTYQEMGVTSTVPTLEELVEGYRYWLRHKPLLGALARSGMYGKLVEYTIKYSGEESIQDYLSQEDLRMNLGQDMQMFVIGGSATLLISWHTEGFRRTPEEMAQIAHRMLCQPLLIVP